MTKSYIWVIEAQVGKAWLPMTGKRTRAQARWVALNAYSHTQTRIRKYVPA